MSTNIPGYLCPSDANPGSTENLAVGYSAQVTCVNYAVNGGVNRQNFGGAVNGVAWWLGGNTFYGNRVSLASITDGTSNTAAFSEWVKGKSGQNAPGPNLVYSIAQYTNGGPLNDVSLCTASTTPLCGISRENTGRSRTPAGAVLTITSCPPNQHGLRDQRGLRQCRLVHRLRARSIPAVPTCSCSTARFGSSNPASALATWNALGTRAGGEVDQRRRL